MWKAVSPLTSMLLLTEWWTHLSPPWMLISSAGMKKRANGHTKPDQVFIYIWSHTAAQSGAERHMIKFLVFKGYEESNFKSVQVYVCVEYERKKAYGNIYYPLLTSHRTDVLVCFPLDHPVCINISYYCPRESHFALLRLC